MTPPYDEDEWEAIVRIMDGKTSYWLGISIDESGRLYDWNGDEVLREWRSFLKIGMETLSQNSFNMGSMLVYNKGKNAVEINENEIHKFEVICEHAGN